jgi:hypothetical protein
MPVSRYYSSNSVPTTLAGNISAGVTTVSVASPTGYPGSFPFTAAIGYGTATEELVDVTAASGGTWTVTRGVDGTSAQSHSIGEAVQHVTSARDSADFQNHQAAGAAVHGLTGTVVGTSDAQTLANKTLTSPTVNAGALSGTFTGAPTLSGAVVFSGAPVFNGTPLLNTGAALAGTFTGSPTLSGNPTFSGVPVFTGGPSFTTNSALFQRTATTSVALRTNATGDANDRFQLAADGKHLWGPGNAAMDTTLYRSAVDTLTTDDNLTVAQALTVSGNASVGGSLSAANMNLGAWASWTPTWSTTSGAHTPSYGNATVGAFYAKIGRMLVFSINITFGSTTNFGASVTTSDNWIFSLPPGLTASANFAGSQNIAGFGRGTQSAANTSPFSVRADSGGTNFLLDTAGGGQAGSALTNTGNMDSLTPWTWATGNQISFSGSIETTT